MKRKQILNEKDIIIAMWPYIFSKCEDSWEESYWQNSNFWKTWRLTYISSTQEKIE